MASQGVIRAMQRRDSLVASVDGAGTGGEGRPGDPQAWTGARNVLRCMKDAYLQCSVCCRHRLCIIPCILLTSIVVLPTELLSQCERVLEGLGVVQTDETSRLNHAPRSRIRCHYTDSRVSERLGTPPVGEYDACNRLLLVWAPAQWFSLLHLNCRIVFCGEL
jgi:hypothetical protein